MERIRWTDERLDDAMEAIRYGSARHDEEIRELRSETRTEFTQLRTEISQLRDETREGFSAVRTELDAFRLAAIRIGGGLMVGLMVAFLSVIATILLRTPA